VVRLAASVVVIGLIAVSCSGSENVFVPVEDFGIDTEIPPDVADTTAEDPSAGLDAAVGLAALPGLIVISSETTLRVIEPDGTGVIEFDDGRRAFLPTWSGDGRYIVTSLADSQSAEIVLVDMQRPTEVLQAAVDAAPFMYTWSDNGAHLATLAGPGPDTHLRIYDAAVGLPISSVSGASVYVAWEPDGTDIVAHVTDDLLLVDGTTGALVREVATVGASFLAADWIPGSRDVLAISGVDGAQKLVRINVDDSTVTEITGLGGPAGIEVSPDGSRVAISHFEADVDDGRAAMTEVLDLSTGERTPISDELSTWLEWSAAGERLLTLATLVGEGMWRILEPDGTVTEGATFSPSDAERGAYLGFGDQYVVSANRWSPDGTAFVFSGEIDGFNGVFVQVIDPLSPPVLLGPGELASWSPA